MGAGAALGFDCDACPELVEGMDDATNEHYSMFFVEEEGTQSSFRGVREVIEARGLFSALYTDRGSHYWTTPEAGGKVDKVNLTQFGRAMKQLGIDMIAAYPKNWPWPASLIWTQRIAICGTCTARRSTENSRNRRWKTARHSCRSWVGA
jgi:hypothetical protein